MSNRLFPKLELRVFFENDAVIETRYLIIDGSKKRFVEGHVQIKVGSLGELPGEYLLVKAAMLKLIIQVITNLRHHLLLNQMK